MTVGIRMVYMVGWIGLLFAGIVAGTFAAEAFDPRRSDQYGAEVNPTGDPIGGGVGYSRIVTSGEVTVANAEELLAALRAARAGDVIYVAPDAELDLTGHRAVVIPRGVTLAGNRGEAGAAGPLIYTDELDTHPLFVMGGPDVRITGLRLRGPDGERRQSAYELPNSAAIRADFDRLEVDNCEIFHWSYAGVHVAAGRDAHIHHNDIHHVQRAGLGYPVVVVRGTALIEANQFDWARHAIAGSGYPGSGYVARYNLVMPHASSFSFDMHGGRDRGDGTDIAGETIHIHHNTFMATSVRGIGIRGVPQDIVEVHNNWFYHTSTDQAFFQINSVGNAWVYNNVYGPDRRRIEVAPQSTPRIRFHHPPADTALRLRGEFEPEFSVEAPPNTELRSVTVSLNGESLYMGSEPPPPGTLHIDTHMLSDGVHRLTVVALASAGRPTTQSVAFRVQNWWQLADELDPPISAGWFGTLDVSRTSEKSEGWAYATDAPHLFYGDASRKVRTAATTEYLVWDASGLREARVVLYLPRPLEERLLDGVLLEVSPRSGLWVPLTFDVEVEGSDTSAWYRVELVSGVPEGLDVEDFRLTLSATLPAEVQLGRVVLRGLRSEG